MSSICSLVQRSRRQISSKQLHADLRVARQNRHEVAAAENQQLGLLHSEGIGGALAAVDHRDLAEHLAGPYDVEDDLAALRRSRSRCARGR